MQPCGSIYVESGLQMGSGALCVARLGSLLGPGDHTRELVTGEGALM